MKKLLIIFAALAASACSPKIYTIVQIADAQLGFDAAVKGQAEGAVYVNDLTYESDLLEKTVLEINTVKPDIVVFTGDQVNYPDNQEQWDLFDEIVSNIRRGVEVYHLPGNHDVLISTGKVDLTPFENRYGDDRFIFSNKKISLIGINSNFIKYDDPREEEQYDWLRTALEQAGDDVLKIVFCHHPFFLTDIDEQDSYFPIQKAKRKRYFDLFADNGVSVVYAGHLHNNAEGEYRGVEMKTATSVAYQIGDAESAYRYIVIQDGKLTSDDMIPVSQ